MAVPAYLAGNLITSSVTITASAADATFSAAHIFDRDVTSLFRFDSASGGNLEFDLVSAQSFDTVAIYRHNFDANVSIVIKAGDSPSPSTVVISGLTYQTDNIVALLSAAQSARYVRVEVDDARASGASQFGELQIETRVAMPRDSTFGDNPVIIQESFSERTNRGKLWPFELFTFRERNYTFRFPGSELADFRTLHSAVSGHIQPFGWIEDTDTDAILYGRKEAGLDIREEQTPIAGGVYSYSMIFTEESPGAEILE